jgi:hypothetical protein
MRRMKLSLVLTLSVVAGVDSALAQDATPSETGWSSWGVLPFSAVDIAVIKDPGGTYVMYYTTQSYATGQNQPVAARAYSRDLKNWEVDPDLCRTAGELCTPDDPFSATGHRPIIQLRDGRFRMFRGAGSPDDKFYQSLISTDARTWTREPGRRFTKDPSLAWERGARSLAGMDFVRLPDGSWRMYYAGSVLPGTEGTTAECAGCMGIHSATSSDEGLTWVREPGVRVNPNVLGPITSRGAFHVIGHSVIAMDGGYRIYTTAYSDGGVTYFSRDGLNFELEGRIPAIGSDIETVTLPDGRLWLVSSAIGTVRHAEGCIPGCDDDPNAQWYEIGHMMVHGPQPFKVDLVQWDRLRQSATFSVVGNFTEPVTLTPILAKSVCPGVPIFERPWCPWHPEYYAVTPATPGRPTVTITYTGPGTRPDGTRDLHMYFEAVSGDTRAATAVYCMVPVGTGTTTYCPSP